MAENKINIALGILIILIVVLSGSNAITYQKQKMTEQQRISLEEELNNTIWLIEEKKIQAEAQTSTSTEEINNYKTIIQEKDKQISELKNEIEQMPCWNEVCEEKTVKEDDTFFKIFKFYKYKNSVVETREIMFKSQNEYITVGYLKEIATPQLIDFIETDMFSVENAYIQYTVKDSDESVIWSGDRGNKPEWYKEHIGEKE